MRPARNQSQRPVRSEHLASLSLDEQNALIAFVADMRPRTVDADIKCSLLSRNLIRPTGPRHCSFLLTSAGRDMTMAILVRRLELA